VLAYAAQLKSPMVSLLAAVPASSTLASDAAPTVIAKQGTPQGRFIP
jgi:hypothetical protein